MLPSCKKSAVDCSVQAQKRSERPHQTFATRPRGDPVNRHHQSSSSSVFLLPSSFFTSFFSLRHLLLNRVTLYTMGDSPLSPTNISSEVGTRKRPLPPSNDDQFGELAREVIFEAQGLWQYLEMHMPSTPSRSIKTAYRRDKPPYWYTNALHHLVNVTKLACGISLTRSLTIPKYISAFFGEGMYSKPFQSQLGILLGITIEPGCT